MIGNSTAPETTTRSEPPADLGFGSVVAAESRQRLLNRNGTFNVRRQGLPLLESLSIYHDLITLSWPRFLALVTLSFLALNTLFAFAFLACGPGALSGPHDKSQLEPFAEAFFFSVHTLATIGYGNITPLSMSANILVTIESLVGLLGVALVAGIMFSKFARPVAQIAFSEKAIFAPYRDITGFMFRIANRKKTQIVELEVKLILARRSPNGLSREFHALRLERDRVAFFPLTWTIVHPIDAQSPLFGVTHEDLVRSDAEFLIMLSGIDETFAQLVHTRSSYKPEEIVFGVKFKSVFNEIGSDGVVTVDLREIHDLEKLPV